MSDRLYDWGQQWLMAADEAATRAKLAFGYRCSPMTLTNPLDLIGLEPRILFSATPIDPAMMPGGGEAAMVVEIELESAATDTIETLAAETPSDQSLRELIIIDSAVPDIQQLLDDLSASGRDADVFVLDAGRDGVDQITEILDSRIDVDSIHIVSHAEDDAVKLGNVWLGQSNLDGYAGQIASWQNSLTSDADILLYGCDLADSVNGQTLIESISALSGADVAASDDDTGHADFGGDWDLEYTTGAIETQIAFSDELRQIWHRKLSIITVDTFDDVVDAGDGYKSLREAIIQANAIGGETIQLAAGTYLLDEAGSGEDGAVTGDLDITNNVTIIGIDATATIIDAGGIDRVFDVQAGTVSITGLALTGGTETLGGAIDTASGTVLNVTDVEIYGNTANSGGGIHNRGTLNLERATLESNTASNKGGGVYFTSVGSGTLTNVTISGNSSTDGGGVFVFGSSMTIVNSTIANNSSGIGTQGGYSVQLKNTILDNIGANADGSLTSLGNNIDSDGTASLGDLLDNADPMLDPVLQINGGTTRTHAITSASPAYNAGTTAGAPAIDQRGLTRDATPDIGAYEFAAGPLIVDTDLDVLDGDTSSVANLQASKGADGFISLREAIIATNNTAGADTINLAAGTYTLGIAATDENLAVDGDLDILQDLNIVGTGAASTVVDGGNIARVFEVMGSSTVSMSGLTVRNGDATMEDAIADGGGFYIASAAQLTLTNVIVSSSYGAAAGGIQNNGTLVVNDSTFEGNTAGANGGGLRNAGIATLEGVTFVGNSGTTGGAIDNRNSTNLTLTNVTISGNSATAGDGGGIFNAGTATLQNVTVTNNTATGTGGGIETKAPLGTTNLANTIVADNFVGATPNDLNGAFVSSGDNLVQTPGTATGLVGGDITGVDPNLSALQDNGGFSLTHAFTPSSAAYNAGTTTGAPALDQRGETRDGSIDIGAYELVSELLIVDTTDDTVDGLTTSVADLLANKGADGFISLREAIIATNNTTGADSISLTAGTYTLGIAGAYEEAAATGDLDIIDDLTITGAGQATTVIDAAGIDRVFDLLGAINVSMSGISIQGGGNSGGDGAGIYNRQATLELTSVTVRNNTTSSSGGGIFNGGDLTLDQVTIDGNDVDSFGGGIFHDASATGLQLTDSTVSGNTSGSSGGGLLLETDATLQNVTISGNQTASHGGGIYASGGTITLNHLTVAENDAGSKGGGLNAAGGVTFNISNSLVANNTASGDPDTIGAFVSSGDNLVEDVGAATGFGSDITGSDPNLAALADNGGGTQTHALLAGSFAINGGNIGALTEDQRGVARVGSPDIGAYEFVAGANNPPVATDNTNSIVEDAVAPVSGNVITNDDGFGVDSDPDGAAGTSPAGHTLKFDASVEADTSNSVWEDENGTTSHDWDVTGLTYTASPASSLPGITGAYQFNGVSGGTGASFTTLPGDPADASASFEIWFRPDVLSGQQILFETGGTGSGTSLYLDGTDLTFATHTAATTFTVSADLSLLYADATSEFVQAVGVIDFENDKIELFVDGVSQGTASYTESDWAGTNGTGIGQVNGTTAAGSGNFAGEIAIFHFYESVLTATEVDDNYQAIAGTTLTVSEVEGNASNVGNQITLPSGTLLTMNADGSYVYNLNGQFEPLAVGETANDTFTYTISDGNGGTDNATVTVTINGANDAPTADNDPVNVSEDDGAADITATLLAGDSDPDTNDTLAITAVDSTGTLGSVTLVAGVVSYDPNGQFESLAAGGSTTDTLTYTVDDGNGGTDTATVTVTINGANDAPTLTTLTSPVDTTLEDTEVEVSFGDLTTAGNENDVDGTVDAFIVKSIASGTLKIGGTAGSATVWAAGTNDTIDASNNAYWTSDLDSTGTQNAFAVVAKDDGGLESTSSVIAQIGVTPQNDDPTVANPIANQSATEDSPFSFQFASNTFDDVDVSDTLTYTATLDDASPLPDWLTFNAGTRTLSGTPLNADVGAITVRVTADDGNLGTVFDDFDIVIDNSNDDPTVANPIADQSVTEDTSFSFQFASDVFDDVDVSDTLTYTATLDDASPLPGWLTFSAGTRTFSGTPLNADVGTITVRVTADDGNLGTVFDDFVLTINNVNDAPTLDTSQNLILDTIRKDILSGLNNGNSVLELLLSDTGNPIDDPNGSLTGIAIKSIDDSNGTWDYSTDGGATWQAIDPDGAGGIAIDNTNALLLEADAGHQNRIRFQPSAGYTGSAGGMDFRAWDGTELPSVGNGNYIDISASGTGGVNPFSSNVETANLWVNAPPTITTIDNQMSMVNVATDPLNFNIGDSEDSSSSLVVTATSSNTALVPVANIVITGTGSSRNVTVTPGGNQIGTTTITLIVTDTDGAKTQTTFELFVAPHVVTVSTNDDIVDAANLSSIAHLLNDAGTDGVISLREAIIAANNTDNGTDADQIILPLGHYVLDGTDLDLIDDVLITGAAADTTRIDGDGLSGVFDINGATEATISGVSVTDAADSHGAIFVDTAAVLNLVDASLRNNVGNQGGAIHSHGSINLNRVTLANNAAQDGGAIYLHGAVAASLTNVTISDNQATKDGGAIWSSSSVTITNATIADNEAGVSGAGLHGDSIADIFTLRNTILAENHLTDGTHQNVALGTTVNSLGNNIDSDGSSGIAAIGDLVGTTATPLDVGLVALALNGGTTKTHALASASIAVDAGTSTGAPSVDQRGAARPLDGDGDTVAAFDIGAFETGNVPATGAPTIIGTPTEDSTLVVDTSAITDPDGLGAFSFQWLRDGVAIAAANANNHTLGDADVGKLISVQVSYDDGNGTPELLNSSPTVPINNLNDLPTGNVTISGVVTEGRTLTAGNTLSDDDGMGVVSYQWKRDGVDISGATTASYTVTNNDVGAVIGVVASYTDMHAMAESVSSLSTAPVAELPIAPPPQPPPPIDGGDDEEEELPPLPPTEEPEPTEESEQPSEQESTTEGPSTQPTAQPSQHPARVLVAMLPTEELAAPWIAEQVRDDSLRNEAEVVKKSADKIDVIRNRINSIYQISTLDPQWQGLDSFRQDLLSGERFHSLVVGAAVGVSVAVSVGQAVWAVRAGYMASTLMTTMPIWRTIDPLPVLEYLDDGNDTPTDNESLQSIVEKGNVAV